MPLIVQKYGGTSVVDVERIHAVAERIVATHKRGFEVVVVVSAMGGETNRLMRLAEGVSKAPRGRELDVLLSTGEQVTIALLCMAIESCGEAAVSYTGAQIQMLTDSAHNKARILEIEPQRVTHSLAGGRIVVIAGFQGIDKEGNITTLGRGGSDTTAVAMAAALGASECQIYTDVNGVYTSDPRIVPDAQRLERLTYEEMLEMASLGAKVLQIRSVGFAQKYNVKIRVLSSFEEGGGTLISSEGQNVEDPLISSVTVNRDEAKLTLLGVPDKPGIASRILSPIAAANIEIDMIVQNVGADGTTDFTFTVNRCDYEQAMEQLRTVAKEMDAREVNGDNKIVKLSVVGVGMRSHAGIASRMFTALADEGINIQMISTSEIKISVVVAEKYMELGARTLHSAFDLDKKSA